jgi:hypothetical protein
MNELIKEYLKLRIKELRLLGDSLDDNSYIIRATELRRLEVILEDNELEDSVEQMKINLHESEFV